MKQHEQLEHKLDDFEENYVTHKHMEAVVSPLQRMAEEIQRDVKKLLVLVAKKNDSPTDSRY